MTNRSLQRPRSSPLEEALRGGGGRMVERHGAVVARDFGSAASEAALCQRAVGIADRCDLAEFELRDRPQRLAELYRRHTGVAPDPDRAARPDGHAWWCPLEPGRLLVVCDPAQGPATWRVLELAAHRGAVTVADRSDELAAIAVIGPRARRLLDSVGELDPRVLGQPAAVARVHLAGADALVLRESPLGLLAVIAAADALAVWEALDRAGHELGAGWVGREALEHLAVGERMSARRV